MEKIRLYLESLYQNLYGRATTEIFTKVGIVALGVLVIVLIVSYFLAKLAKKGLMKVGKDNKKLHPLLDNL